MPRAVKENIFRIFRRRRRFVVTAKCLEQNLSTERAGGVPESPERQRRRRNFHGDTTRPFLGKFPDKMFVGEARRPKPFRSERNIMGTPPETYK